VILEANRISAEEQRRVLSPGGWLIEFKEGTWTATTKPVPDTIDQWTHFLYDASGNAVSRDKEVASPRSFRWYAPPKHLRSHNYSSSFTGLVSAGGRVFYILDEGTFLFDKGGATEKFSLIARDAFNGALLWKKTLEGYGQPSYEDVSGQAVNDFIWRAPLSMNRRLVAVDGRIYAALKYRQSPLSILDAATGELLHQVELGGVDEIIAEGDLVICRVRPEIPMPTEEMQGVNSWEVMQRMARRGIENPKDELRARVMDELRKNRNETIAAVDATTGKVVWQVDAPLVGVQCLAMANGKVVYHDYEELIALDAKTGERIWSYDSPAKRSVLLRNLLGNLLIADGKMLWTSSATGGGVCLNLEDGTEVWKNNMGTTGGFGFPTAQRVIRGVIFREGVNPRNCLTLSEGTAAAVPEIGDMLKRGHHVRCFPGKATERFLINPMRGAEFIDLSGAGEHMVNDWLRGACSLGQMPANGLFYVTPDPCSCYAGARIYGFHALAPREPAGLETAPSLDDPMRLSRGAAWSDVSDRSDFSAATGWPQDRGNAKRTALADTPLNAELKPIWTQSIGGDLTQATVVGREAYVTRKDTYQLFCLNMADGRIMWTQCFPAVLNGPPTILTAQRANRNLKPEAFLYAGCGDGSIYCLRASDGAIAWRRLLAPLERLTLDADRLSSVWPVDTSVLFHNGLIYTLAGRNSYLDGGIHLFALDPATGAVRHSALLQGPWPDMQTLKTAVITERDRLGAEQRGAEAVGALDAAISTQYATGYNLYGGEADLLVTDGTDIYLTQNKFDAELNPVPLKRKWNTGYTPMGGYHMMADSGFLDDTMFHRTFMMYDDAWSSYGTGPGSAARGGTLVAVGKDRAYAAQHFEGGGYAGHAPGDGNRIVADSLDVENLPPGLMNKEQVRELKLPTIDKAYNRTAKPLWVTETPIIIRAFLAAPDAEQGELLFSGGIVEGNTLEQWDKSTYFIGPGKLQVHGGKSGELLAEYDLPACPVFDGLSAAEGCLLVTMVNGQIQVMTINR
jgi:outer membrane protein assembly factor BamB